MLFNTEVFYFATIRKITVCFGNLFSNIIISRYSENGNQGVKLKTWRVPLSYGPSEKWLRRVNEQVLPQDKTRTKMNLPRISFEFLGMQYDEKRKLNTLGSTFSKHDTDPSKVLRQLNPVPYDLSFEVNVMVKNHNDGLQIIEQILPNFAPSFNLPIKDIPELCIVKDVPVILAGITKSDTFEGALTDNRVITWTLTFVVKGYLYPNIKDSGIIKTVISSIYPTNTITDPATGIITVSVDPIDADVNDVWSAHVDIQEDL